MIEIKLLDILKEKKITQKELSETSGVRPATISVMCHKDPERISLPALSKICTTLDCRIEDILVFTPDQP